MKRLHIHVAVPDLSSAVEFYENLFADKPAVRKTDYAKWMLEDPRVNFAISARGGAAGVEHLGIQVDDAEELVNVYSRLEAIDKPALEEGVTTCCYARSEKSWITDPAGVPWEVFLTMGEAAVYGGGPQVSDGRLAGGGGARQQTASDGHSASAKCC